MAGNNGCIVISQLDNAGALGNADILPVVQEDMGIGEAVKKTKKTTLGNIKEFFLNAIPAWAKAAKKPSYTATEVGAATPQEAANAANTSENNAKAYTDTKISTEAQQRSDADIAIHGILNNLTGLPAYNNATHVITFTAHNGATFNIDLPIESLAQDLDYDPATKILTLTKQNGDMIDINIADLIDVYKGHEGTHIQTTVDSGNVIKAVLLAGSITETELSFSLAAKLNSKTDKVTGAANGNFAGLDVSGNLTDSGKKTSDFVQVAGAQTVNGVKTFSSIPVLPEAGPETDNHAVRKAYVDNADQNLQAQIDILLPEGLENIPEMFAEVREAIDAGNAIHANKKIITPPLQAGSLAVAETSQQIESLVFDIQGEVNEDQEGVGFILFSDGSKIQWDGTLFALLDSGGNIIETFYDADLPNEKWSMANYQFAEKKLVEEIAVSDGNAGPWPLSAYSYQPPGVYTDFPDHADDEGNPHKVTAEQAGAYSKAEADAKLSAIINMGYIRGYWYGRKITATPWPLPPEGEAWAANAKKAFDFATNKIWIWDGADWIESTQIQVANGTTIGISESFLDIVDSGFPGKAVYSGQSESWDFYPDKLGMEAIQKAAIAPGKFGYTSIRNEADMAKFRQMPSDGRTISVHDSRAERLLQYCLIPHAAAVANPDIIGLYLTNEYYPDHDAWLAANKQRAAPAENGAYIVIPDGCGIHLRGSGKHGGHKAADNTPL